jgi:hypothetical protein
VTITNGYVTLNELKAYLDIPVADITEDALLEQIVEAASRSIDRIAGRTFSLDAAATARYYRTNDPYSLIVDDIGSTTSLAVALDTSGGGTYPTAAVYNTDFIVEPLNALAEGRPVTLLTMVGAYLFPYPWNFRPGVRVTAKWGWPSVPDDVVEACLILSADLYKRKSSVGGVLGLSEMGAIRMSPLGRDIAAMVRAYRREVLA